MARNGENIVEERLDIMSNLWKPDHVRKLRRGHFLEPSFPNQTPLPSLSSQNQNSSTHPLKVDCLGWQRPHQAWDEWVLHMEPRYGPMWKALGIFESIKNTTIHICPHADVVRALVRKWCPETNTFVFKWGEATVTLEDVCVLGRFSVTGESVCVSVPVSLHMVLVEQRLLAVRKVLNKLPSRKCTYNKWLKHVRDERNEFGDIEHEAFLVFWLSKFVFPKVKDSIGESVHVVAIRLAMGVKIALGPAVLASIYRDLTILKRKISICTPGQVKFESWSLMHLVQAWAWERFPTLCPSPNSIRSRDSRLSRWHDVMGVDVDDVGGMMDAGKEGFKWRPYCTVVDNWTFSEFYRENEEWVEVEIGNGREEQFAMFIRHSELVGLDGSMEPYLPHRVAMQFGMNQDVPGLIPRVNANAEAAWAHYKRPFGREMVFIPPRLLQGDVTARYASWWNRPRFPQPADEDGEDKLTISELQRTYIN